VTVHAFARNPSGVRRPAFDVLVERVARSLLAWSTRRSANRMLSHERMALLLSNDRTAPRGGSTFAR
jgi:hypothetical protein